MSRTKNIARKRKHDVNVNKLPQANSKPGKKGKKKRKTPKKQKNESSKEPSKKRRRKSKGTASNATPKASLTPPSLPQTTPGKQASASPRKQVDNGDGFIGLASIEDIRLEMGSHAEPDDRFSYVRHTATSAAEAKSNTDGLAPWVDTTHLELARERAGFAGDGEDGDDLASAVAYPQRHPLLALHNEILDFCQFISPTTTEQSTRKRVLDSLRSAITSVWPGCRVRVFGSMATGMYLPVSDIDLVVLQPPPKYSLFKLAAAFRERGLVSFLEVISKARIPIIKLKEKISGIAVDICVGVEGGLHTSQLLNSMLAQPHMAALRPLTLVLKYFLLQRSLNETYSGGVGSFLLQMMIVSMLQHRATARAKGRNRHRRFPDTTAAAEGEKQSRRRRRRTGAGDRSGSEHTVVDVEDSGSGSGSDGRDSGSDGGGNSGTSGTPRPTKRARVSGGGSGKGREGGSGSVNRSGGGGGGSADAVEDSLGWLLLEFFHLYGRRFNYCKAGLSVRGGGSYFAKADRGWFNAGRPDLVSVENPLEPERDVGTNSFRMSTVRRAFAHAHDSLTASIASYSRCAAPAADAAAAAADAAGAGEAGGSGSGGGVLAPFADGSGGDTDSDASTTAGGGSGGGSSSSSAGAAARPLTLLNRVVQVDKFLAARRQVAAGEDKVAVATVAVANDEDDNDDAAAAAAAAAVEAAAAAGGEERGEGGSSSSGGGDGPMLGFTIDTTASSTPLPLLLQQQQPQQQGQQQGQQQQQPPLVAAGATTRGPAAAPAAAGGGGSPTTGDALLGATGAGGAPSTATPSTTASNASTPSPPAESPPASPSPRRPRRQQQTTASHRSNSNNEGKLNAPAAAVDEASKQGGFSQGYLSDSDTSSVEPLVVDLTSGEGDFFQPDGDDGSLVVIDL